MTSQSLLAEHVENVPLIDHHVHGCWLTPCDRSRFENALNEANTEALADFDTAFDTQLGFAVRAHCAPVLGLPRHTAADSYWDRRTGYSEPDVARRFLTSANVSDWLVDTGFSSGVADLAALTELCTGRVHEIVRVESVAEEAIRGGGDYASTFRETLHRRAAIAVATKSILAYRGGFAGDLFEPEPADVADAAARWKDSGEARLTDRVLLRFGLYEALRLGKPLQFHIGFGDRDADLHLSNPLLLLDFLRRSGQASVMLLHCYPYEREAGYLAQAFNNVYLDGGLAVNYLGARSADFIGRLLEMAPFSKILYSSDGFGPAELHYLGARLWRDGIHKALQRFVDDDEWSQSDAIRVTDMIAFGNARRVYGLG